MNHTEIEDKWKAVWDTNGTYKTIIDTNKPKFYVLSMFPNFAVVRFLGK